MNMRRPDSELVGRHRTPSATYRLQFNRQFTFDDAAALVPYLHDLGISHCYASPYLKARSGSPHGYDIVDHSALNPEIGSERSFERFVDMLEKHGLGQILDLVPNHMGVGGDDNAWWLDVLENGSASAYAGFFDIDWFPNKEELRGKVLVPVLGGHYGAVLENGELRLTYDRKRGEFSIWYYNHRFPLEPRTYPIVMDLRKETLATRLGQENPLLAEYQSLISAFGHLPSRWESSKDKLEERRRDKEVHKRHLSELCRKCADVAEHIDVNVRALNGEPGESSSFDTLHTLLEQQVYRLAYWQVASDEINYRRFFDINDLAGLRMEEPQVFDATHRFVLQLVREGRLDGLRIDHPDGLYDPHNYYVMLREKIDSALVSVTAEGESSAQGDCYLVVEKILASYERLVESWPVQGTTGYDFTNLVNGLYVRSDAQAELDRAYWRFIGQRMDFDEVLFQSKRLVIEVQLSSELTVLSSMLDDIAQRDRHTRDFTLNGCREAITTLVASFPVYRTYVAENRVSEEDKRYVDWAVAVAKKRSPATDVSIFDFIRRILLDDVKDLDAVRRARAAHFVMKLQQYTSPVMAKAMEDTAFYLYNRLVSLNEVGGDPRRFGASVAAFHHANQERARQWPHAMLATSTHDTKRSEDVRARINVISELHEEWRLHVSRWARVARNKKIIVEGRRAPSRNDEYLFYQILLGAWPAEQVDERALDGLRARIRDYMLKAVKEAKVATSWINPNLQYEEGVCHFVERMLHDSAHNPFLADFLPFQRRVAHFGYLNSLSQTLLKLTVPGVPDIYQGTELWDFSLVDPDNRRPVDYRARRDALRKIIASARRVDNAVIARELAGALPDGRAKLYVIWKTLELRRQLRSLFQEGEYVPLAGEGVHAAHICAFARRAGEDAVITFAPRCVATLLGGAPRLPLGAEWADTGVTIPFCEKGGVWRNVFTEELIRCEFRGGSARMALSAVLAHFPVGLLIREAVA